MILRTLHTVLRWTLALLTAWHRDSRVRTGEAARSWDALDRAQRWMSVAFYALLLWIVASNGGVAVPDFGQGETASWWIGVGITALLSGFVVVVVARRVVVSNRNVAWRVGDMPRDLKLALFPSAPARATTEAGTDADVHVREPLFARAERGTRRLIGFPLVLAWLASVPAAIVLPHFVPSTAAVIDPFAGLIVVGTAVLLAVVAGAAQSVGIASDAIAKVRMLSPVRAAFGGTEAEYERSRFRLRGNTLTVRNAPASVFADLDVANAKLASISPDWMVDTHRTDAATRLLVLTARVSGDAHTERLRNAFASYLNVQPFELNLEVALDDDGRTERIDVLRYPRSSANLDRLKRISTWRAMVATTVERVPGTRWIVEDDAAAGTLAMRRIDDLLAKTVSLSEFRGRFPATDTDPATSWRSFPVAIREDGSQVDFGLFHTLCVGQTGAGKGSVIWGVLQGILPAARAGYAKLYAVDPKGAEAIGDDGSPRAMFEDVATTPDDWADLLHNLVAEMNSRKGKGRKLDVREHPLVVVFIDELSALSALDTDSKRRAEVMSDLLLIASQGRSLNFLLLAAVQAPQKDMVGPLRDFLAMRVALRTGTALETDIVLGAGSTEAGAEAHLIPVANQGNHYATAGTGFMRVEGEVDPVRLRFPYTSDADLDRWDAEFRELRASGVLDARPTRQAPPADVPLPDAFEGWDDATTGEQFDFELPETQPPSNDDDPFAFLLSK